MISDRWLLPEGVDEILPPEAARLENLRRQVLDLHASWGYELVIPPFIEYLESHGISSRPTPRFPSESSRAAIWISRLSSSPIS